MIGSHEESARLSAACAAAWWAGRLRDASGVGDNGAREIQSVMACAMTRMIRDRNPPTEANCERFEIALRRRLVESLTSQVGIGSFYYDHSGWDDGGIDVCMRVDYHPDPILLECLAIAGVERNIAEVAALPLKTTMRASARRIILAHGYAAPWVEIYGPAWGSTRAEHAATEAARSVQMNIIYDAMPNEFLAGAGWSGPVQP